MHMIEDLIDYLDTFVKLKVPYRWWKIEMPFYEDDMFYTNNGKPPTAKELIIQNKSVVCSGLINLSRRFMGLTIPEIDGIKGSTWTWFRYLNNKEPINLSKSYPIGTLLLRDYFNSKDQGHLGIIVSKGINIDCQKLVHSIPFHPIDSKLTDVGYVTYSLFSDFNYDNGKTFFTHICLPQYWLY